MVCGHRPDVIHHPGSLIFRKSLSGHEPNERLRNGPGEWNSTVPRLNLNLVIPSTHEKVRRPVDRWRHSRPLKGREHLYLEQGAEILAIHL